MELYSMLVSLFFLFSLSNPTLLTTSDGQLLPIVEEDSMKTYIVHVLKPEGRRYELLGDEDLENWHRSFLPNTTLDTGSSRLVYSYRHAISGFAARLTSAEVRAMQAMDGFLYAHPSKSYRPQTTYTPEFLGLSQPFNGSWAGTMYGEGIIIGVIDTGILPTHPSFDDAGMPPPPLRWRGNCSFPGFPCNNKIIGAKGFDNGANHSPVDDDGHGTHVASIAAGNFVDDASVLGNAKGRASGMAPRAHLAIYKVGRKGNFASADILAAIEQAIKDGVDVITMSIGPTHGEYSKFYDDDVVLGSLAAFKKGISTCTSAGNSGPGISSLNHGAPWILTVGASTTDRRISVIVKLGNGMEFHGESGFQPRRFNSSAFLPLEFPGRNGDIDAQYCVNGSLANFDLVGKIVMCGMTAPLKDVEMGEVVYAAGAAAMIVMGLRTVGYTTFSDAHVLPAAHVKYLDARRILDLLLSNSTTTAALVFNRTQFGFGPSPAVASFSSRGPSQVNGDIVKPDVLAPGVNILAAWPFQVGPNPKRWNTKTFNFLSGTSMAAPHVAGIVALVRYRHSGWSPAAIQSAIITSSRDLDRNGNAILDQHSNSTADIYARGAGQVNPGGALDPGLVYDLTLDDYVAYLCGLGYNDTEVIWTIGQQARCSAHRVTSPSQLNYPSIAVSMGSASSIQTVGRTVTNVGNATELYRAQIEEPKDVKVYLSTYRLKFSRVGQQMSFNVTLQMTSSPGQGLISAGRLTWKSKKHVVASPIAVRFN